MLRNLSLFCLLAIGFIAILFSLQWGIKNIDGSFRKTITSDGLGYYNYLTSIYIDDDFSNQTVDFYHKFPAENGRVYNKYFSGTALLMSPFFAGGHFFAGLLNYDQNGFSEPYQVSIALAGLFYLFIGLLFVHKFLKSFRFSSFSIVATLLFLFLGTNLLSYSILFPSMSHIYSFSMISIWLYLARKYWLAKKNRVYYLLGVSFVMAIIILIRPTNGVVFLLFPFLSTGLHQLRTEWKNLLFNKKTIITVLIFGITLFIQPLLWYYQTEQWVIWSYSGEGFDFVNPELFNVLFSYRKGWWLYTPLMLIATIGIFFWLKKNKILSLGLLLFLSVFIYITSSWWNWYYGSSFGQRPFVDIYGVLSLGLAIPIQLLNNWKRYVFLTFCILCCGLNLIQTYQYQHQILSPEYMTKEKYNYVFLETDPSFKKVLGGNSDIKPFNSRFSTILHEKLTDVYCTNKEYCSEIKKQITTKKCDGLWIEVNAKWKALEENATDNTLLVLHIRSKEENSHYLATKISPIPTKRTHVEEKEKYTFHIKDYRNSNSIISIFFWNKDQNSLKVEYFEVKVDLVEYLE